MPTEPALRIDGAETSVQRKSLAGRIGWSALGVFVVALLTILVTPRGMLRGSMGAVVGWSMLAAPVMAIFALFVRVFHWRRWGAVAVEGGDLVLERGGHARRIPLTALAEGSLSPLQRQVEMRLHGGDVIRARLPTVDEGRRLLEATGLDASRRTLLVRLGETASLDFFSVLFGPSLAFPLALRLGALTPFVGPVTFAAFLALSIGFFRAVRELLGPAQLLVGADGLIVRQSFRTRFFSHDRVVAIDVGPTRVELHLTDGSTFRARAHHLSPEQQAELRTRIEDARGAWQSGAIDTATLARLDRNGRSAAAWREALRGVLREPEGYREQPLTRDDLVRVLESPAAPPERRVAAAMALSEGSDPEDRARIRIAAEACADAPMRLALAKAAAGDLDDDAIEEAVRAERAAG